MACDNCTPTSYEDVVDFLGQQSRAIIRLTDEVEKARADRDKMEVDMLFYKEKYEKLEAEKREMMRLRV